MKYWRGSGARMARAPRRSVCAGWCSSRLPRSRAPRSWNGCRRTSRFSTSSFPRPKWPRFRRWAALTAALRILVSRQNGIEAVTAKQLLLGGGGVPALQKQVDQDQAIRTGVTASVIVHLTIVALLVLMSEVHPLGSSTESIAVDIVTPQEVEAEKPKPEVKAEEPQLKLPETSVFDQKPASQQSASQQSSSKQPPSK